MHISFLKLSEEQKNNAAYFYDLNMKLNYKFDSITVFTCQLFGRDVFSLNNSFTNLWQYYFKPKMEPSLF
jgi:hypothetical protein